MALIIINDVIRIAQNHFTSEEEERIHGLIQTDIRYSDQEPILLINNSPSETFREVLVDPSTGVHIIYWDAIEEQRRWDGRDRRVNDPRPTFIGPPNIFNQQDQQLVGLTEQQEN